MSSILPQSPGLESIVVPIRNSVRALIVQRNQVLLLRKCGPDGSERHAMPGGGQDVGELLPQALLRECGEEIGCSIEIVSLLHVVETFKSRERKPISYRQQVEFVFHCRVPADYRPHNGPRPDKNQVAVEWVGLQRLDEIDLRPPWMVALIRQAALGQGPVYLGAL